MTGTPLKRFLETVRTWTGQNRKETARADLLITGNEACDLDSMVSALTLGFSLWQPDKTRVILPLIPIKRADFPLRTEAVYLFNRAGIDPSDLIFADDLDPGPILDKACALALVDHNRPFGRFAAHKPQVCMILDHHEDEGCCTKADIRIIEPVGSCATLAGEMLLARCPGVIDDSLALLITGTILLDTVNLDASLGRTTDRDEKMVDRLSDRALPDRHQLFRDVQRAKFDCSALTSAMLFKKDYKRFTAGPLKIGVATVLLSLEQWAQKEPDLPRAFADQARAENLDILLTMHAYNRPEFRRELGIFCTDEEQLYRLVAFLQQHCFDLTPLPCPGFECPGPPPPTTSGADMQAPQKAPCQLSAFSQKNVSISRKQLIPLIQNHLAGQPILKGNHG